MHLKEVRRTTQLQLAEGVHSHPHPQASGRTALEIARAYGNHKLATNLLAAEREARETTERKRVAGVHAAIRAAEEARIARAEHERQLRLVPHHTLCTHAHTLSTRALLTEAHTAGGAEETKGRAGAHDGRARSRKESSRGSGTT